MEAHLIPLGFRCNAAFITNKIVDQPRFVFDWVQMNIESMICVLKLKTDEIRGYWEKYFSELDEKNYHKITGSWFPHDSFKNEEDKAYTLDKYVRRTERLHQVLRTNTHVIFLLFQGFPDTNSLHNSKHIIKTVSSLKSTNVSFIVCNSCYENLQIENTCLFFEPLYQMYENSDKDWDDLTSRLTTRVSLFLKDKNISVIPFSLKDA